MSCKFSLPFTTSSEQIISKAKSAISSAGGKFMNEGNIGTFELPVPVGKIEGAYNIADGSLHINITHKPLFVSCHLIEHKLKEYLGTYV